MTIEEVQAMAKGTEPTKRRSKSDWYEAYMSTPPPTAINPEDAQKQRALFERHDKVVLSMRMPLAPTANNLKSIREIPGRRPFLVPSTQYNAYKEAVADFWKAHNNGRLPRPITGRLRLLAVVHMTRNGGDVANREKALCDSMTECGVWLDDEQIDDVRFIRGAVLPPVGALDVIVESIE